MVGSLKWLVQNAERSTCSRKMEWSQLMVVSYRSEDLMSRPSPQQLYASEQLTSKRENTL